MKPNKYIVSKNGTRIAVGIIGDKEQAQCDVNLAHNIFNSNDGEGMFSGLIFMESEKQFKRLLIWKEYFQVWDEFWTKNKLKAGKKKDKAMEFTFLKRAVKRATLIWESSVEREDFMLCLGGRQGDVFNFPTFRH